jgi:sugar O-acyltransferase (sialic acid O-acetyltransferase NeuD family)
MNNKDYILWGSTGHAKVLAEAIGHQGGRVIALFDNDKSAKSSLSDVPLIFGMNNFKKWTTGLENLTEISALVAIGGAHGRDRLHIQEKIRDSGITISTLVHSKAFVAEGARLGAGTQVLAMASVAADTVIGNACIVNHRASVDHECNIGEGVHIAPGATLCGCVGIDDFTMVGAGSIILPRLKIGKNCVIGAGSIVTKNVPNNTVVLGNPAKYFAVVPFK